MRTPRFRIEAFAVEGDESRRPLGVIDLTKSVLHYINPYGTTFREMQMPPMVMTISSDLDEEQRQIGMAGQLALPGFAEQFEAFFSSIGGKEGVLSLNEHLRRVQQAEWGLEEAVRMSKVLEKAQLGKAEDFDMVCPVDMFEDFVTDVAAAYDGYAWEAYGAEHPRPEAGFDSEEMQAWNAARSNWLRRNAPPFVFGATPVTWGGVRAEDVRLAFEEDDGVDIEAILENEMSEHHEDAYDHLVDLDEIHGIIEQWEKHAGTGDQIDQGLETALAGWNAKQNVTSYYEDRKFVVPAFPDVTLDEIRAWGRERIAAAESRLAELENGWVPVTGTQDDHPEPGVAI